MTNSAKQIDPMPIIDDELDEISGGPMDALLVIDRINTQDGDASMRPQRAMAGRPAPKARANPMDLKRG
ncbi:MAG: hypothetical protein AAGK00_17150 [Pseudomonadota bacterium]